MRKIILFFISLALTTGLYSNCSHVNPTSFNQKREPAATSKAVQDLYQRFVDNNFYDSKDSANDSYQAFVNNFNSTTAANVQASDDWIDSFLGSLPERVRRHYTFVHKSYSIQSGTPMAPRTILFTPDARTIMTFNSKLDENNQEMANVTGSDSVEVIQWNVKNLAWDFAELKFKNGRVQATQNPPRCVLCHAGTPKPILAKNAQYYQGKLKPIFPQYPLWPGFYGSVNDIIGVPGTGDTIMANETATKNHINGFLFGDSEELGRLRAALDKDKKYMNVVRNEMDVHHKYFSRFIESTPDRPRYKHLVPLTKLYTDKGENPPAFLDSAPYRRTFDKKFGHYILRPNFFLSTLVSFYHAQAIAREIMAFPEYDKMKYSFLAAKFNCDGAYNLSSDGLKLTDLNPSFDLIYPNTGTQQSRDKQYLLAYQYNLVHADKSGTPNLPLFAWNLESNEEIASYHYGNVFSDLNEIVLWNLAANAFDSIRIENGRSAHEARHADFNVKNHFERNNKEIEIFARSLNGNSSQVSRFTSSQMNFATSPQKYYGMKNVDKKFKGLPVSKHCRRDFIPAAKKELKRLALAKSQNKPLPHEIYPIDKRLIQIPHVPDVPQFQPIALNGTRQACEACHSSGSLPPQFNTDWHSENYHETIKALASPWYRNSKRSHTGLKDKFLEVLDPTKTLPVPFGNLMPYGRRAMDPFSLFCEKKLINNAYSSNENKKTFSQKFNCSRKQKVIDGVPQKRSNGKPKMVVMPKTPENILNCKCRSLYIRKHLISKDYYYTDH